MSQPRELGKGSEKMAISYASGLPADHTQVLPSFRELLPPHLHDEIDSISYLTARQNSRERPASAHRDMTSNPRPLSGEFGHFQPQLARNTPQYPSRGPSPILPPIRDLQQGLNASTAPFPDARGLSRPDPFGPATQDFRGRPAGAPGFSSANRPRPMGERGGTDAYNGPAVMHTQMSYHYPIAYHSDSEQTSPQGLSHTQPSNFGILGDPIDSKNKRRRGNLPKPVTDILRAWFHEHLDHPYPSEEDKQMFMTRTGLTISQISNWFINARRRQLPALRNQMRTGGSDLDSQRQSPFSDVDHASSESMPSPSQLASAR
ncbi:Homeobox KN domain protein [Aspergillus parasiticus SU-1]|uniref:Homeobox KN domain-containing protein n=3 Tax=Aspergillus subgen. Circumdati TaxID=2720871 RepID=A0A5N6D521_ASPPA|nr:homeobox KN domain-containing protein [Aspergillus parasiticus]KAE8310348.1 homeobox KN domain-containing protein [Aspergillus transmontanensis]KJK65457.1 Homeobox KN domain protein [Aspergillus parasiticus SU-1]